MFGDGCTSEGVVHDGRLIGSIQAQQTVISGCSVDGIVIEHSYAVAGDPVYSSAPVVVIWGVAGNYMVAISDMTIDRGAFSARNGSISSRVGRSGCDGMALFR